MSQPVKLDLTPEEAKDIYIALDIARDTLTMCLQLPICVDDIEALRLASIEERALKFADLMERFKGYAP